VQEREEALDEGNGARGGLVTYGAATVAGNATVCNASAHAARSASPSGA
jgi:hypothetical protein